MSEEGATDPPPEETPADDEPAEDAEAEEGAEGEGDGEGGGDGEEEEAEVDPADLPIGERIAKDPIELGFLVNLPEVVSFENIPRINDSRGVWK